MASMFDPTKPLQIQNPELLELSRQRRMADLLTSRGMETPQGQMVGPTYVPTNPLQYLANLYSVYVGTKMGKDLDKRELALAEQLRQKEIQDINRFSELQYGRPAQQMEMAGPYGAGVGEEGANIPMPTLDMPEVRANPQLAFQLAATSQSPVLRQQLAEMLKGQKLGEGEVITRYNPAKGEMETVAAGTPKVRPPIQIDTGTTIELRDPLDPTKVLQRIPKAQMPTAGQVVETANGPMLVNTRTGQAQPIMAGDQPLAPKLSSEQSKDIVSINQQRETIRGALKDVEKNKNAFSFGRGLAQALPYGESIAGRLETPEQTQTRAYVFNNVSAVIKERAGTAQSAQELQRINSFMPAVTDNAEQIIQKLKGFEKYLDDLEKGTRQPTSKSTSQPQVSTSFASEQDAQEAFNRGQLKVGDKITINGVQGTWR